MKISLSQILYSNYIKYNKLQELTLSAFANSNANEVNIFIDVYDMITPLYRTDYQIESDNELSACIINLCAHFRSYYMTRHRVETKIFIVYSPNTNINQRNLYPGYNSLMEQRMNDKRLTNFINHNLKVLDTICPYLDKIYYVSGSDMEPAVIIHDLIQKQYCLFPNIPNIVITKSVYAYQLPAINRNTVIFRPKKYNHEDTSYIITHDNVLVRYIVDTRKLDLTNEQINEILSINTELLGFIMAMTNLSCRSVKSVFNINTILNYLRRAISEHMILNSYNSNMDIVIQVLSSYNMKIYNNSYVCSNRCKAIDLLYQYGIYKTTPSFGINYIIDLIDDNQIRAINNEYFKEYPLDLNRL